MKQLLALWFAALTQASAQTATAEFPVDAVPVSAESLKEALAGKVFDVKLADGTGWRLEYKANGHFWVDTSRGFSDKGTWSTPDGKLCSERQKATGMSCNDVRACGSRLLLKRDSGEIIELVAR